LDYWKQNFKAAGLRKLRKTKNFLSTFLFIFKNSRAENPANHQCIQYIYICNVRRPDLLAKRREKHLQKKLEIVVGYFVLVLFWKKTNKIFLIFSLLARGKEHTHTHYYHHLPPISLLQRKIFSIVIRCLRLRLVLFFFSLENYKKNPPKKVFIFFCPTHFFLNFNFLFQKIWRNKQNSMVVIFQCETCPPFLFLHCSRPSSSATITILLLLLPLYIYTYIYINVETGSFS
jgi:hypothetical protein